VRGAVLFVNRHYLEADPDPKFHFDADEDPDVDPTPRLTHVGKPDFF
jgi:hypothetical protein